MSEREKTAYYLPENAVLPEATGHLRLAHAGDHTFLVDWIRAFYIETLETKPPDLGEIRYNDLSAVTKRAAFLYVWQTAPGGPPAAMGMLAAVGDKTVKLNLIFVPKQNRRKGCGRAVVAALCALARGRGETPVLNAYADNAAANKLYQNMGFIKM